jgi:hypothetical protein
VATGVSIFGTTGNNSARAAAETVNFGEQCVPFPKFYGDERFVFDPLIKRQQIVRSLAEDRRLNTEPADIR